MKIDELIVDGDERVGGGGFLEIRRLRLRNRRSDGSVSAPYICDSIARPYGQDAVVVVVYADGPRALLRAGLRPAIYFGRDASRAPLPEAAPQPMVTELVAGILEDGDVGEAGMRVRASHEVAEEAGFVVDPADVELLGAGMYPSPGSMIEKFYFVCVKVDPVAQQAFDGDGSPMEDGATTRWLDLDEAIAACVRGEIVDLKTELGLRRLREHLTLDASTATGR